MDAGAAELDLVARLRAGDEDAFVTLVDRYHRQLVRLAATFVTRPEAAEDVAQETWLALLRGLDRFEGRSSLRTWLFGVCMNRARSIGAREKRLVPVERIALDLDAERFDATGAWTSPPVPWPDTGADEDGDARMVERIRAALLELPTMQRLVVTMRDVDGLSAEETCTVLAISAANQRVLLHRGRGHIRAVVGAPAVTG